MGPGEVVVEEVERHGGGKVLHLPAEGVGELSYLLRLATPTTPAPLSRRSSRLSFAALAFLPCGAAASGRAIIPSANL